ncbi:DUF4124 domain-containing protein [Marinobacter sp. VGCF2001]|uniref:DUF4124 domain-containing protein n=1 Tax=Marinobacter sp. VGCF2001 TaxID=3417189 RepID=UPI003CE99E1F
MKAPITLATALLMLVSTTAYSEVYRHVDAYGNVTFSDEPMDGGEEVKVKPVTTITLPKPEVVQEPEQLRQQAQREGAAYQSVSFQYPSDEQAFHSGNGNVTFEVQSSPGLQESHRFEITLDGQPVGQSRSGTVTVNNIDRGTHSAGVHIVDGDGVRVKTGSPITFTIHRPSALN